MPNKLIEAGILLQLTTCIADYSNLLLIHQHIHVYNRHLQQ